MYLAGRPRAASGTSARSCGARASPPAPCRISTTRPSRRSRNGGQAAGTRVPVRLYRRHLPEAQLRQLLRERRRRGSHRRERRRLPRGDRLRRGLHRVAGMLARFPVVAEIARPARRSHDRRQQGRRHGRLDRRGLPRGQIPALHGAFLPQRAGEGPQIEEAAGGGHAQGRPRDGVSRGGFDQSRGGGR